MKTNVYNKIGTLLCLVCFLVLVAVPVAFAEGDMEPPAPDVGGAEPTQADNIGRPSPPPVDSALIDKATQDPQVQPSESDSMQPQTSGATSPEVSAGNESKSSNGSWVILVLAGVLLVLAAGAVYFIIKRKPKA